MSWQPIETAPRDRTMIIYGGEGWATVGRWLGKKTGWYQLNTDPCDSWADEDFPTHWMPLPEPPSVSA